MPQIELFDIPNPCIGVCQTAKNGLCIGCLRNRNERQTWYQMDDDAKHHTLKLLAKRKAKLQKLQYEHLKQQSQLSLQLFLAVTPDLFDELDGFDKPDPIDWTAMHKGLLRQNRHFF